MAGNRIKGITVEICGDTTKLQTALKGVNSEIKNTQAQLKDVKKLLKLDPGNSHRRKSSPLSRLLQSRQIRPLQMVTSRRSSTMHYCGRSSKRKKISKNWKRRQTSLLLQFRRSLLLVKA